ncbi:MAG: 50S ribosomal protein L25 [Candidatus Saccharimonadales bacterium]
MADAISLALQTRKVTGKAVKSLRKSGQVPAVIHDHGKPSVIVEGNYVEVLKAYKSAGRHHTIELKVGPKNYTALIKTAEFEPRKHQLNHVVFGAVSANETVTAEIPIRLDGEIPAERASLIVINQLELVEVEALPKDLPDEVIIDATGLAEIGDRVTIADIKVPSGVKILTEPDHGVASVYEPSALAAANDAAGGDAEAEDAAEVESEEGSAETDDQTSGEDEIRPGGKQEKEDKSQGHNPEKQ